MPKIGLMFPEVMMWIDMSEPSTEKTKGNCGEVEFRGDRS